MEGVQAPVGHFNASDKRAMSSHYVGSLERDGYQDRRPSDW